MEPKNFAQHFILNNFSEQAKQQQQTEAAA
jgi:hypothetical protein